MSGNIWGKYRRAVLLSAAVSMLSTSIEGMCGQGEANPLIPFMAVTGKPSREFTSEFLKSYREVGIEQVMIYARTGLELEYMGSEWLEFCKHVVEECKRQNFKGVWLYDEYNWPSGSANKKVMKRGPEYCMHYLKSEKKKDGSVETGVYVNGAMPYLLNPEAVDYFINLTHEEYKKVMGEDFGGIIKGFFTDEPSFGYYGDLTEHNLKSKANIAYVGYYDGIEKEYNALSGRDLKSDAYWEAISGATSWRKDANKLLAERFAKTYIGRLEDWCASNGMLQTGHLISEQLSKRGSQHSGHPLTVIKAFGLPGIDDILTPEDFSKLEFSTYGLAMYGAEHGKHGEKTNRGALNEMFALGPVDANFGKIRAFVWFSAGFGIDHYLLAISPFDFRANVRKFMYMNVFSRAQPNFRFYRELGEDAKEAARWAKKERIGRIGLRWPYLIDGIEKWAAELGKAQLQWKFLTPEESAEGFEMVINPEDAEVATEEKSGKRFNTKKDLIKYALDKGMRRVAVLEKDGKASQDVFLREYADGSLLIINFGEGRELEIEKGGKRYPVKLEKHGVLAMMEGEVPKGEKLYREKADTDWEIGKDAANTMRAVFKEGRFEFEAEDDIEVVMALRQYEKNGDMYLDGKKLEGPLKCDGLPKEMREFYSCAKVKLAKGKHAVELKNAEKADKISDKIDSWEDVWTKREDYPYLPNLIIIGEFSEKGRYKISRYNKDGEGLRGLVGNIWQKGELRIPEGASKIAIKNRENLACELFIGGESMGRRLWSPFEWELPERVKGKKVEVKVVRATTLGRIFGDMPEKLWPAKMKWVKRFSPDNNEAPEAYCEIEFLK